MTKIDIKSLEYEKLIIEVESMGEKSFRGKQIFSWLHNKKINSFEEMTNLSKMFIDDLKSKFTVTKIVCVKKFTSTLDNTRKYLFQLEDGNIIEAVGMEYKHGLSICISSQVGCRMGCSFCASTVEGLIRNLNPSEMLEQIYYIEKDYETLASNIVIMGSGEPLDNFESLLTFLRIINHKDGRNISHRNITVSTCGIISKIKELANEKLQINLAISLHAPNNKIREEIMPINKAYNIEELINVCKEYIEKTNRRITFEYSLINGLNDSEKEAKELAALIKGMLCHVNLIPVNEIDERTYRKSNNRNILQFKKILEKQNINVTIRRELGQDIDAACGQLRRKHINNTL